MAEISKIPTKEYMEHLNLREGFKGHVYKDTEGKLTAGTGHLLTDDELKKYKEGDVVDKEVTDAWLLKDSSKAYSASLSQAKELGISNQEMINALAGVNFQLGTSWNKKFKGAWSAMEAGDFDLAAKEAMYKNPDELKYGPPSIDRMSNWYQQTPTRVADFSRALKDYSSVRQFTKDDEVVASGISG